MYQPVPTALASAAVLGTQVAAANGAAGKTAATLAQQTLPLPGFAFGLYILAAVGLIVAGLILRRAGATRTGE